MILATAHLESISPWVAVVAIVACVSVLWWKWGSK